MSASVTTTTLLTALAAAIPKDVLRVPEFDRSHGNELCRYSILSTPLMDFFGNDAEIACRETKAVVEVEVAASVKTNRALGALVGLVIGDGVGAPLEFLPTMCAPLSDDRPHLRVKPFDGKKLSYVGEFNKFGLHRGQWTDDSSMALCLADSLLCRGGYEGGDCRTRYNMWWFQGYNNAFRFDKGPKHSCGLGGNIANSLEEVNDFQKKTADKVPPRFTATGEDAGNGSIMRLGAVPVRYSSNIAKAMAMAIESSYATHPGPDAAACCAFLSFAVVRGIHRTAEQSAAEFLDATVAEFLALPGHGADSTDTGFAKLAAVLTCNPPSPKEEVWDWKREKLAVTETVKARAPRYNGYPVSAGYFGSYCMDGMAMAMWAFRGSSTFSDAIIRITNLLGDCDTTGAIAGQMAGAFYGYTAIPARHAGEDDPTAPTMGQLFLQNMQRWDPMHEIQLRALLLHKAAEAEGHAAA